MRRSHWESLLKAEDELHEWRVRLSKTPERAMILKRALTGTPRERLAALNYLVLYSPDVPEVAAELFEMIFNSAYSRLALTALSTGWPRDDVAAQVCRLVEAEMPEADDSGFLCIAELLAALGQGPALASLAGAALNSQDGETQEAGRYIREHYSHVINDQ